MESKKINQLATELTPSLSDLTIIGDPSTGISKKITLSQMASLFTGTVEEYASLAAFPLVGVADTIYIALDTNVLYRWDTGLTSYVELSPNIINSLVFNDANGFDGTIALVGSVATLTITTALTTGSVGFIGASGALLQDNANFFWDDTNNRLGLGTNAPTTAIDVFGSGIIGRLNGTSTNNAFLGFASAGTNKWSIGNVQSDHRFRIYNEATTSELVSLLETGEFGIGIANPTTKLHIDGGASALIANLDANVSVAKSLSFRSDNSNRINLEVSGTESGSNAGANFFIRRYSDAGALIDTPLTITRSTGAITLATALNGTSATFSGDINLTGGEINSTGRILMDAGAGNGFLFRTDNVGIDALTISSNGSTIFNAGSQTVAMQVTSSNSNGTILGLINTNGGPYSWAINAYSNGTLFFQYGTLGSGTNPFFVTNAVAATFASTLTATELNISNATQLQATFNSTSNNPYIRFNESGASKFFIGQRASVSGSGGTGYDLYTVSGNDLRFFTNSNGTAALTIDTARNVGIGTVSPVGFGARNLDVNAGSGASAYIVARNSNNTETIELAIDGGSGYLSTKSAHPLRIRTTDVTRITITSDGYISLNNIVYGNTVNTSPRTLYIESGTGSLGGISSIRASKKNIENVSNINWLYQLNPVTFNYRKKDDKGNYTEEIHDYINYGLIAEDTAPIIDFIINYNEKEDGTKEMAGIEYPRLIIPMLKAIQELKLELDELKSK
jgi:hypothetical protein